MKVLLIYPPITRTLFPPLGIALLKGYLTQNGVSDVRALDLSDRFNRTKDRYLALVSQKARDRFQGSYIPWALSKLMDAGCDPAFAPEERRRLIRLFAVAVTSPDAGIIGFSIAFPEQLYTSLVLARYLKSQSGSRARIVFGGSFITKNIRQLQYHSGLGELVDYIVAGRGEKPLLDLVRSGQDRIEALEGIPNLFFHGQAGDLSWRRSKGSYTSGYDSSIVPDFSDMRMASYERVSLSVSNSCFWGRCAFCTYACGDRHQYSEMSAEKCVEVIKALKARYRIKKFSFMDDMLSPVFVRALVEVLRSQDLGIEWEFHANFFDLLADRDFCRELYRSGCRRVNLGAESFCTRILLLMDKYCTDPAFMSAVVESLYASGMKVSLFIMYGFPSETVREAMSTYQTLMSLCRYLHSVSVSIFSLEEGTPVFLHPERFGIKRIFLEDKDSSVRMAYHFESSAGMSVEESADMLRLTVRTLYRKRISVGMYPRRFYDLCGSRFSKRDYFRRKREGKPHCLGLNESAYKNI